MPIIIFSSNIVQGKNALGDIDMATRTKLKVGGISNERI
jgi:hypothetical protein